MQTDKQNVGKMFSKLFAPTVRENTFWRLLYSMVTVANYNAFCA